MIVSLWTRILDFISPRTCVVCGGRLSTTEEDICVTCNIHLPRTDFHSCPTDNPLAKIFWEKIPIERATAMFYYEPKSAAAHLIYSLKYFSHPEIGVTMGRMFASELQSTSFFDGIDVIVPIPLSRKRRRKRGYNQSEEIARGISHCTKIPINTTCVKRKTYRQSQTRLGFWQRQDNVEETFHVTKHGMALTGKHVLLVDDIVTTGATITACAEALKGIGDIRFSVIALGYTKY